MERSLRLYRGKLMLCHWPLKMGSLSTLRPVFADQRTLHHDRGLRPRRSAGTPPRPWDTQTDRHAHRHRGACMRVPYRILVVHSSLVFQEQPHSWLVPRARSPVQGHPAYLPGGTGELEAPAACLASPPLPPSPPSLQLQDSWSGSDTQAPSSSSTWKHLK